MGNNEDFHYRGGIYINVYTFGNFNFIFENIND